MLTRAILKRYAETLPKDEQQALQKEIPEGSDNLTLIEAKQAFTRANLAELYEDLSVRIFEFADQNDLTALSDPN